MRVVVAFLLGNIASLAAVYTTNKWQDKKTTINAKNDLYKSIAAFDKFDKDRVLDVKKTDGCLTPQAKAGKTGSAKSGKGLSMSMMFDEFEFETMDMMDMSLSMDMSLQSMNFANINSSYRRKRKLTTYALIDAFSDSDAKSGKGTNPHHKKLPKSRKVMQQNMDMEFGRPNKPIGGSQEETFLLEKHALSDFGDAVGSSKCELMKNVMSFCSDEDSVTEDLMGVLTKTVTKALDKMPQGRQLRGIDVVGDKEEVADLLSQLIG